MGIYKRKRNKKLFLPYIFIHIYVDKLIMLAVAFRDDSLAETLRENSLLLV